MGRTVVDYAIRATRPWIPVLLTEQALENARTYFRLPATSTFGEAQIPSSPSAPPSSFPGTTQDIAAPQGRSFAPPPL